MTTTINDQAGTLVTTLRGIRVGQDQMILEGIQKDLQHMPALYLGGKTYTPATLTAYIGSRIAAANRIITAKAEWLAAIKAYKDLDADAAIVVHDLKALVLGAFGRESVKLADFGFRPRKKPVLTPEQKAAAVEKRKATRLARGTMGPKAKLAIKGTVG